ncbi:hypothetical protein ABPG72_003967 [Tetrahymena utriculariae]
MITIPEEDQVPTIIFPTVFQQGSNMYDNPFEQGEDEIGQIEVFGYDGIQNKGGKGKIQTKSIKSIKQIQKELAQRMQRFCIFSYELIKLSNGTIKKLYLLLYNTAQYSYSQYETYIMVQKDPKLLENCCQYALKLHEKLIKDENVHQIQDKNSLIIMNQMKEIIEKMQLDLKDNKQNAENGVKKEINEALKTQKKDNLKDNEYENYNKQIEKIRVQKFDLNFSASKENEALFQYFKEIYNQVIILILKMINNYQSINQSQLINPYHVAQKVLLEHQNKMQIALINEIQMRQMFCSNKPIERQNIVSNTE